MSYPIQLQASRALVLWDSEKKNKKSFWEQPSGEISNKGNSSREKTETHCCSVDKQWMKVQEDASAVFGVALPVHVSVEIAELTEVGEHKQTHQASSRLI